MRIFSSLLFILFGCSQFGVDSLIDEKTLLSSNVTISSSLASNLKVDMQVAGIDSESAELIANSAISLSSSLESAPQAYSIAPSVSLYQQVSEKFIEGAMLGVSTTTLSDDNKVLAAGVNSYTPIRTMSQTASAGMSEADKQAAVEAISSKAVAKLQSTGIDSSKLKLALTKISERAVEGVSKSGVSASAVREMVKKASGGATKGLSQMGLSANEVGNLVSAVAEGSVKGLSAFSNENANDLLSDVSSGLSSGLASVQEEVSGFDMYTAVQSMETSITNEATSTLNLDSTSISNAVSSGQDTITLPTAIPTVKNNSTGSVISPVGDVDFQGDITVEMTKNILSDTICYTEDDTQPSCNSGTCISGNTYVSPFTIDKDLELRVIACAQNKLSSLELSYSFVKQQPALPEGISTNVEISSLSSDWTQCYVKPYNETDAVSNMTDACSKENIMVACRETGSNILIVSASAKRTVVFAETGTGLSSTNTVNGVQWYFSGSKSIGFAPAEATVYRNSCDTGGGTPPSDNRLCWHTSNQNLTNGWSCGNGYGNSGHERIVFHSEVDP